MEYEDYIGKSNTVILTWISPKGQIKEIKKVKDKHGLTVGNLIYYKDGDIVARDRFFNYLGRYEKKNITKDFYQRVYKGVNLVEILIEMQ